MPPFFLPLASLCSYTVNVSDLRLSGRWQNWRLLWISVWGSGRWSRSRGPLYGPCLVPAWPAWRIWATAATSTLSCKCSSLFQTSRASQYPLLPSPMVYPVINGNINWPFLKPTLLLWASAASLSLTALCGEILSCFWGGGAVSENEKDKDRHQTLTITVWTRTTSLLGNRDRRQWNCSKYLLYWSSHWSQTRFWFFIFTSAWVI